MADLSAVLRKTIDGLPNATPELRAKVYEKARAAIIRQIENANPPLPDDVVHMRRGALEDAIESTEAHYASLEAQIEALDADDPEPAPARPAPTPRPLATPTLANPMPRPASPRQPEAEERPRMPRAEPVLPQPGAGRAPDRRDVSETAEPFPAERAETRRGAVDRSSSSFDHDAPIGIPDADTSAPRYAPQRAPRPARKSRAPLAALVALLLVGVAGAGAYLYGNQIGSLFGTASQEASTGTEGGTAANGETNVASAPPSTATAPTDGGSEPAATPPAEPKRRFTQRLLPDGSEVDEGPAPANPNDFDEGTNIAAATPEVAPLPPTTAPATPPAATVPPAAATPPAASAQPNNGAPAVAQKAMFYEERTDAQQGTQQAGNVVWSLVNEEPGEGQPPEPAVRAVADIPNEKLKLTMTIRRNADATLPASHVIELQFDVPPGFAGGQIANVQRLALKPSEEARGDPLIGVAGKISDGFFIIALNNLDKAEETNLALLGSQQWIDIPIAYATGRRALMSIEKGVPGDRVFKQAIEAWAAKT